jgi:hypothetical protein
MAEAIETGMKAVRVLCKGLRAFAAKVSDPRSPQLPTSTWMFSFQTAPLHLEPLQLSPP